MNAAERAAKLFTASALAKEVFHDIMADWPLHRVLNSDQLGHDLIEASAHFEGQRADYEVTDSLVGALSLEALARRFAAGWEP